MAMHAVHADAEVCCVLLQGAWCWRCLRTRRPWRPSSCSTGSGRARGRRFRAHMCTG